ncbi:pyruvate, water dikinase regulatory protein [Bacillus sp. FJAT-50079]|uniref:pyruvate, water dikinase regulatory protein n=1 Tax=Bacillus sp. FJAT-50079 TaxID=2833577 RepID=UPI001BCA351B|nr:pyruvate, water dikinase regulatory protein [Bacillus sp. FJAT-50079]MBS4209081.1 kinase/pyrophosphorylase [Bacillus sp. FJAT-50079]
MSVPIIYVVSDSVGETAELVTKAAISQFGNSNATIKTYPYVEEEEHMDEIIEMAKDDRAIIVYTLVKPNNRVYLRDQSIANQVTSIDIMGPIMDKFEKAFERAPLNEPGLVRKLDENYFKRVEAIEFAVKYDDGRDPRGLLRADIILIGVSRTSKTPLSQYLALKRYKVANVPVVPEVDPPEELFKVDPSRCIGLKISPEKLNHIRRERLLSLGLDAKANYANIERIKREIKYFDRIANKLGCTVIDVSNKAVEETANTIINYMQKKV